MTFQEFKSTVERINSNVAGSLDWDEKRMLNSIDIGNGYARKGREWTDYFQQKIVKVWDENVSIGTLARKLIIKPNPKNPNMPMVTYNWTEIGRRSEVAALLQIHAITTTVGRLRKYHVDWIIWNETATALRGASRKTEGTKENNFLERNEKSRDKEIIDFIDKNRITITGDSVIDKWIKNKKITFKWVPDHLWNITIEAHYWNSRYKREIYFKRYEICDKKGVNKLLLNRKIINGFYTEVRDENTKAFNKEMEEYQTKIKEIQGRKGRRPEYKDKKIYECVEDAIGRCNLILKKLRELEKGTIIKYEGGATWLTPLIKAVITQRDTRIDEWWKRIGSSWLRYYATHGKDEYRKYVKKDVN